MSKLRVLSYNIHKGFTHANIKNVLKQIRHSIREVNADLVCLQEVSGGPISQFEFLADQVWHYHVYGQNAVYQEGHHGNAILSKFPIVFHENINVTNNRFERRGILHSRVELPKQHPLEVFSVHFDLFEAGRQRQLARLCHRVESVVKPGAPIIISGDFNDWRRTASDILHRELGLEEVSLHLNGQHSKTFPAWMPVLSLDRIYVRGMKIKKMEVLTGKVWKFLSDHAAVFAELEFH
jgi:endonuclease/exonuclease/phosphatase family metal-dependent hydrolase